MLFRSYFITPPINTELTESDVSNQVSGANIQARSEERRVGKECRSRWSPGFKRTEGQEDEDPTLGVACVGGSGGSTGMASSLRKRTVAACKSSMRNEQVHHIPDYI